MKPVLLLLASLVLAVLVFLSGVVITANMIATPEPHRFANMDTPDLWTSRPKPVDIARQHYERLPATKPPVSADTASNAKAENTVIDNTIDNTVTGSVSAAPSASMDPRSSDDGNLPPAPLVDAADAQWCYARYRSYRVEDNSYQPYNGPRRQCRAPEAANVATVSPDDPRRTGGRQGESPAVPGEAVGAHEEWCFDRYRSYRVEDNSYQPFDGSSRRQCRSPHG